MNDCNSDYIVIKKIVRPESEGEIIKNWIYKDKCYISCVVLTFNQKGYIRDTIDSILGQETEYRFDIIIHDDVSTDGTRDILLEYKNKYPSIIKLILQDENQYSQGKKLTPIAMDYTSSEYIALCEGDDFWIDKQKLQKQIVELEKHKDINLVISKAISLYPDGTTCDFCDLGNERKVIPFEECILGPKKDFFPTASFFLRKKIFDELPDWFYTDAPVGDYYIQLFAAKYNGVIYLPEATTVYRLQSLGSWTSNVKDEAKFSIVQIKRLYCLCLIKKETPKKYHKYLNNYLRRVRITHFFKKNDMKIILKLKLFTLVFFDFPVYVFFSFFDYMRKNIK